VLADLVLGARGELLDGHFGWRHALLTCDT
jgi:hypothetical protein